MNEIFGAPLTPTAAALINPQGGIDWLYLPAFDAGSFFGAILDETKGGSFSISPTESCRVERRYLDRSAILETRFITVQGTQRLRFTGEEFSGE